jgi:Tol biopolymer transport system component
MRVAASGGTPQAVTTLGPQQLNHRHPQFLPDGQRFLYYLQSTALETTGIYLGALDGSSPTRLTTGSAGVYLQGWLLWVRAGKLVAQRLDLATATLSGTAVTLADGVASGSNRSAVSVAATGLVAYRTGAAGVQQLRWFDRSGTARGTAGDPDGSFSSPRVSPDGRRIVVERTVQGNTDLWLLDGPRMSRFTFDAAIDNYPLWSPDGMRIAFRSTRNGASDIYQKLTNGTGLEERLLGSDKVAAPFSWSADGCFLLYTVVDPKSGGDLWILPVVGDRTPSLFLQAPFREAAGVFSPDGRWVAFMSNESGRQEIYLRPFVPPGATGKAAGAAGQWQVSTAGGIYPLWRPDGKELYYLNPEGVMMAAPISVTGATPMPGAPARLFPTRILGGGVEALQGRQYDVAHDGRFLINTELDGAAAPITLIQNWKPEANRQ